MLFHTNTIVSIERNPHLALTLPSLQFREWIDGYHILQALTGVVYPKVAFKVAGIKIEI